jgi:hypothetical protein
MLSHSSLIQRLVISRYYIIQSFSTAIVFSHSSCYSAGESRLSWGRHLAARLRARAGLSCSQGAQGQAGSSRAAGARVPSSVG